MRSVSIDINKLEAISQLSLEHKGEILSAIFDYAVSGNHNSEGLIEALFYPFKKDIDQQKEKYERMCARNRENGNKPKKKSIRNKKTKEASRSQSEPVGASGSQSKRVAYFPEWPELKGYLEGFEKTIDTYSFNYDALRTRYLSWIENNGKDGTGKKIKNFKSKIRNLTTYPQYQIRKQKSSEPSNFNDGF